MHKVPRVASPPSEAAPFVLTSANLSRVYFPGWGLLYSLLVHGIALTVLLFFPVVHSPTERFLPRQRVTKNNRSEMGRVIYLPAIGGGGQGLAGKSESSRSEPSAAPTSGRQGLVYPGAQQIRSDPALPTNRIQTLIQPGREDLPILKQPLDLPNLISMTDVGLVVQPRPPDPAAGPSDTVKPEEEQPVKPSDGLATEAVMPGREDLPILRPPLDLPKPISMMDFFIVLEPSLPDPAMGLPDIVKPEEEQPLKPSDDLATEPVQPEPEDLILRSPLDLPKPTPMTDVRLVSRPGLPDLVVGQPDFVKPEQEQPVEPSDGLAAEQVQPEPEDLILRPPLDLPKPIPMREVGLVSQPSLPDPAVGQPDTVKPEEEQPAKPSDGLAAEQVQPALESHPPTPIDASKLVLPAPLPLRRTDLGNLLVLTPMPTWPEEPVEIPKGEARGLFAISPQPNLAASETEAGSPLLDENQSAASAGESAAAENTPSLVTITFEPGGAAETEGSSSGGGGGAAPGSRPGSESGPGVGSGSGAGTGPGKGPFAGMTIVGGIGGADPSGSGAGPGPSNEPFAGITIVGGVGGTEASGPGAGSGPNKEPFAGMTILGGVGGSEASANSVPESRILRPLQTKYGLSVLSTEDSGGGLPYFGVFSDEQIHTVYLDMRQRETDAAPLWTLEFAQPRGTATEANPAGELDESQPGFVKPLPTVKEKPALPLDLVGRHRGKVVIVYAVINVEGKMEQMSVQESPDPLLNRPVLDALSKWVFRPGLLNGDPVAVKALLGIPLWLPVPPG